ncbi:hypothetical protein BDI4_1050010 [Burkholderia diffusa]|nr:hypothetical protein BDI4_1050010 [Burkholderia diffusa]
MFSELSHDVRRGRVGSNSSRKFFRHKRCYVSAPIYSVIENIPVVMQLSETQIADLATLN